MIGSSLAPQGRAPGLRNSDPREVRAAAVVFICNALVLAFYLWLASSGTWTHWHSSTRWHSELATAFQRGQLSLLVQPGPELLALQDPYDAAQLEGVDYPMDHSLYDGKFYAYFGPVPALLLAPLQGALRVEIGDEYLGFAFIAGLFILQSLLARRIWTRLFRDTPLWSLAGGVLVLGLAVPSAWLIAGAHWSAASVMGGAFFLMAGISAAYSGLISGAISRSRLALAGAFWAAAIGTRAIHGVAVVLLAILVCSAILVLSRRSGDLRGALRSVVSFGLPLLLGLAALGWYNWARFDSPFETGLRFALNPQSMASLARGESGGLFSPVYVIQNVANYLLRPPSPHGVFPFVDLQPAWQGSVIPGIVLPVSYHPEWMTGLFWAAPFILFAACTVRTAVRGAKLDPDRDAVGLGGIVTALWIAFLAGFSVIMPFFWAAERYMADFVFPLYLLSVIGFWQCGQSLASTRWRRAFHVLIGLSLIGVTILVSNLLAIGQNQLHFRSLNPGAWERMVEMTGGDLRRLNPEMWRQLRELVGY